MSKKDPRVDAYIDSAGAFAKPILLHFRNLVHTACPEITETIKWGFPHFDYKGIVCSMAAFKQHCAIGFWKESLLKTDVFAKEKNAMGSFGRITSLKDLPSDKVIVSLVQRAVELNEAGIKPLKRKPEPKRELVVPADFLAALQQSKKSHSAFENMPYSHRKEYIEWINEAKTETTRSKRIATAIEWLAEGKSRNWKYEKPQK
jgi:uncharacterized protein YdeI (YjbR/CyaY-like superfamily)